MTPLTEKKRAEAYVREKLGAELEAKVVYGHMVFPGLALQHWLRVMREHIETDVAYLNDVLTVVCSLVEYKEVRFDLTTGQPENEAAYKAFNEITGTV